MLTEEQLDVWANHLWNKISNDDSLQSKRFIQFIEVLKHRTENNKDAIVCVCGNRGMGKTSLAIVAALLLRKVGLKFNFTHISYGGGDFKDVLKKLVTSEKSVFVFDEMLEVAYSREAMTNLNRKVVKIITRSRKLNHIVFLCLPSFTSLDKGISNHTVHYWIQVFNQSKAEDRDKKFALATLHRKDGNVITTDPWGIDGHLQKKQVYGKTARLKFLRKLRSFITVVKFPPMPKAIEDEYEPLSKASLAHEAEDDFLSPKPKKGKIIENPVIAPQL